MANDIIVSEMTSASQINTNDLMIMTQPDLLAETGYSTKKGTVLQVANKMLKGTEYPTDLPDFTDKTVLGGLEELKGDLTALLPVGTASGAIANFDTDLSLPLVDCKANIVATGGNGTPDNPISINGYSSANIVNTQNESIVDLFSIDSDFRGTVVFNQLVYNGNFESVLGWSGRQSSTSVSSNIATITPNSDGNQRGLTASRYTDCFASRKYLLSVECLSPVDSTLELSFSGRGEKKINVNANTWKKCSVIYAPPIDLIGQSSFYALISATLTTAQSIQYKNAQAIDLTQMFGSTIADYIYTLEQNEAGAGVEFFRNIYPDSYYPYDIGTTELVGKETPEATIAFGQTVYGGQLDVTRGKLHVTHANIASYNGESINEPWLSSMDVYTPGGTPTTGAQVVYPLTTPFDIDLTPVQINALIGVNNIYNDTNGDTEVSYKEGIQHYIDKKIAQTQALIL